MCHCIKNNDIVVIYLVKAKKYAEFKTNRKQPIKINTLLHLVKNYWVYLSQVFNTQGHCLLNTSLCSIK